jgi:hypothetical protein
MFLRSTTRLKDGKKHYYWSIVENRRCRADRVVQQTVLYLGEINDSQREQWIRAIEVFDEERGAVEQLKLFAAERPLPAAAPDRVQVRLKDFELHRPRQWGGCWLFSELWKQLQLDEFWRVRLGLSREGTDWEHVLQTLVCDRLLDPGSEWRLHRVWFEQSAMSDLLAVICPQKRVQACAAPRYFVGTEQVQRRIISWELACGVRRNLTRGQL